MSEDRKDFHRRRRTGIGGSDVGPILGVDRYRDVLDVYLDKVKPPPEEEEETPDQQRGRMLENVVTQLYMDHTDRRLRPGKFRRHRDHDFLIGHPDRIIVASKKPPFTNPFEGPGVLEAKTANRFVFERMKREGLPQSYLLQLQHYMGVCGTEWGSFAVLCPDPWQFITFDLQFDEALFNEVAGVLKDFWENNVLTQTIPTVQKVDWSDAPEPEEDEEIHDMDREEVADDWFTAVEYLREAKQMRKTGEAAEDYAKEVLKLLMQDKPGDPEGKPQFGIYEGAGARIYYRQQDGRVSFDKKSLIAMEPLDPIRMATLLERAGLDLDTIETLFENSRLDMASFEKKGKPFPTIRVYDSTGEAS